MQTKSSLETLLCSLGGNKEIILLNEGDIGCSSLAAMRSTQAPSWYKFGMYTAVVGFES